MNFQLDRISEESFLINLTLNLKKHLEKVPGVVQVQVKNAKSCSNYDVCAWESDQGLCMPDDLKAFYCSTNGFQLTWDYLFAGGEVLEVGLIYVNPIHQLVLQLGCCNAMFSEVSVSQGRYKLNLGPDSRVFELTLLEDVGKVCLVYLSNKFAPTVWLVDIDLNWYYLADNFSQYFRMAIAHFGLPLWQLCVVPGPLPTWVEQLFLLIAPHLLPAGKPVEEVEEEVGRGDAPDQFRCSQAVLNVIDSAVFRTKQIKPKKATAEQQQQQQQQHSGQQQQQHHHHHHHHHHHQQQSHQHPPRHQHPQQPRPARKATRRSK